MEQLSIKKVKIDTKTFTKLAKKTIYLAKTAIMFLVKMKKVDICLLSGLFSW
jgi:hypothetical protein